MLNAAELSLLIYCANDSIQITQSIMYLAAKEKRRVIVLSDL